MKTARQILFSLIAAAAVTALLGVGSLDRVDKWVQDSLFQRRGVSRRDILIIGIDDDAMDILGPYNTWGRGVIAAALETLASDPDKKPAVTAVDVLYDGENDEASDARLANAARELGNVVTASLAVFGETITWENGRAVSVDEDSVISFQQAYEALRSVTQQGHINAMCDRDGVLRHALLYVESGPSRVYSMAYETARLYREQRGEEMKQPPVNAGGHFYVPFTSMPGDYYDGVSVAMLLSGRVPADYWAGKIVLIGPYATALQDAYFTSIDKGGQMFGVEFQANVIQSLLDENFKAEAEALPQLAALFIVSAAAAFLFLRLKVLPGAGACALLAALGIGGSLAAYSAGVVTHPLWLAASSPLLYAAAVADHYIRASKEKQALALENERIGAELSLATRIQSSALPKEFPPFPQRKEFDIYASMTPAKEVGGDLFDFFLIDDDHLALVIGDVSGKGVPAALFMMVSATLIRHVAKGEMSPAKVLETVNARLCERNPEEMFVTVWLGVLEISTGKLTAANAGHEFPVLKTPGGDFELYKDRHGFVLGGMAGMKYREYGIQLEKGSKFFVYTDGVPEATDASNRLFGTDRMVEALRSCGDDPPEEILRRVHEAVDSFVGAAPQFDDLTMLCLAYNGPAEGGEQA